MKVSQILLVVLLTAILSIFLGMILQNNVEKTEMKVIIFSITILSWVFLIVTVDLYTITQQRQKDMTSYMKCN